jgi:internalin A
MNKIINYTLIGIVVTFSLITPALSGDLPKSIQVVFNIINLEVNGQPVKTDNLLYNETTYIPLRAVSEMLDKKVDWNPKTNTAGIIEKGEKINSRADHPIH